MPTVAEDNVALISESDMGHPYLVSLGNPLAEFLIPRRGTVSRPDSIFPDVIGRIITPGGVEFHDVDPDDEIVGIHRNPFDDAVIRH
jgi:hypothetical protein